MKNIQSKKGIWIAGALGLLVVLYFGYQNYQENQRNSELTDFAIKHNQKASEIEKVNKDVKAPETSTQKTEIDEDVKVVEKDPEVKEGEYRPSAEEIAKFEPGTLPRKIVPYTETLPEMPSREVNNSTLLGIDTSEPGTPGYGVRDDVEIAIVKEFGDNSDATKFMMASMAYQQKMLEMYQTGVDYEVYNYLSGVSGTLSNCSLPVIDWTKKRNEMEKDELRKNDSFFFQKRSSVKKLQFNTPQRVIAEDKADGGLGSVDGGTTVSHQECLKMLSQSVKDFQSPIYLLGKEN